MTRKTLDTKAASAYIGISESSLRHARMKERQSNRLSSPPHIRLGRKILYLKDDLDRWLNANRVVSVKFGGFMCD